MSPLALIPYPNRRWPNYAEAVYDEDALQSMGLSEEDIPLQSMGLSEEDIPATSAADDPGFNNSTANTRQLFTQDGERLPFDDGSGGGSVSASTSSASSSSS